MNDMLCGFGGLCPYHIGMNEDSRILPRSFMFRCQEANIKAPQHVAQAFTAWDGSRSRLKRKASGELGVTRTFPGKYCNKTWDSVEISPGMVDQQGDEKSSMVDNWPTKWQFNIKNGGQW